MSNTVSVRVDEKTKKSVSKMANRRKGDRVTQADVIKRSVAVKKMLEEKGFYLGEFGFFLSEDRLAEFGDFIGSRFREEDRREGTEFLTTIADVANYKGLLENKK